MFIRVIFENGGQEYEYFVPGNIRVRKGQIVLVNVYGSVKAAKVTKRFKTKKYPGQVKSICGVGILLEEIEQPTVESPTFIDRIKEMLS